MNAKAMSCLLVAASSLACATAGPHAVMPKLELGGPADDLFRTDTTGTLSEESLHKLIDAPVFIEERSRVGVLQVSTRYEPEAVTSISGVPAELNQALEQSGMFDASTEVASDWPAESGVAGLRQLAARYRVSYLLLYRQRFVDKSWWNAWGWLAPTVIGAMVAPNQTIATDGILEATLFDVRTGTLVFTVFERVHATQNENVWNDDLKLEAMEKKLAAEAAQKLCEHVVVKTRRFSALRPKAAPPANQG